LFWSFGKSHPSNPFGYLLLIRSTRYEANGFVISVGLNRVLSAHSRTQPMSSVPMTSSAKSWLPHGLNGHPKPNYAMFHLTLVAEYSKFSWRFLRQIKQVQLKVTGGD